jgi:hypothetical protein
MSHTRLFRFVVALALALGLMFATATMKAQTVIANEALATTIFVVNKVDVVAGCRTAGCRVKTLLLAPVSVTCPAPACQTCTFHISLDSPIKVVLGCTNCQGSGTTGFYQFLIDDAVPTIGPTGGDGNYVFESYGFADGNPTYATVQNYPASILTTVTNSTSNSHTISLNLGCWDAIKVGGC